MMKRQFPLLIGLLLLWASAQAGKQGRAYTDSLLVALGKTREDSSKADLLNRLSRQYISTSGYDTALIYAQKAKKLAEKLDYQKGRARAYNNIGLIYDDQGNYPEALKYYFAALKISEAIGDQRVSANEYNNIGLIYATIGNYPEALKHLLACLKIEEAAGDKEGMAGTYGNIGIIYAAQKKYPEALANYSAALKMEKENGYKDGIANNYGNMGLVYYNQGNFREALKNHLATLKLKEETGHKQGIAGACINIGSTYIALNQAAKGKIWLQKALELSLSMGAKRSIHQCYIGLTRADSALNNFEGAFENHKMVLLYQDSLFNEENTRKQTRTEMQYTFDKKMAITRANQEKKDASIQQQMQRQRLVRNSFIAGFAVVMLFAGVFFRQRNSISKEKKISDAEKKKSDELLRNILPAEIADELKQTGVSEAKLYNKVTVLFTDFVNFTGISEQLSPTELVAEIHKNFTVFDAIIEKYGLEKIKTIGDAYLAVCGLPHDTIDHAEKVVLAALEICDFINKSNSPFQVRIGINSGPVVAGIVGVKKYAYDIWGDTVNTAARMEQHSEAGKINISGSTYNLVKSNFPCTYRGKIEAKNKGEIDMYFVDTLTLAHD